MIHEELQQLSTSSRDLRKFGLLVGGVFVLLGGWLLFRHKAAGPWLATPGVLLVLIGLIHPRSLKQPYLAWMLLAFSLGLLVSRIILTLFFFILMTPIALVGRLCGKDFLAERIDPDAKSYWLPRDSSVVRKPADYEQQF